jgi:hypothetical protein
MTKHEQPPIEEAEVVVEIAGDGEEMAENATACSASTMR